MNYRYTIELETEKNGRKYLMHIPIGAPFTECYEVVEELKEGISFLEKQERDRAAEAAAAQAAPVETVDATPVSEITD